MRFLRKATVVMLGALMLSAACMGAASAQQYVNVASQPATTPTTTHDRIVIARSPLCARCTRATDT